MQERNRGLDGLRGMAILLVLMHHFFKLPGGWAGVDIFFVLSGFLITTILRQDRQERKFWSIYFARRATRILPPFLLLLAVAAITVPLAWKTIWPYYVFFGANLASYRFGDDVGPLTVLWSLAIEEHFYFVWPGVVRHFGDKTLAAIAAAVLTIEPLVRLGAWSWGLHDWAAFYTLTPFRLDGLALGALLSVALSDERMRPWLARRIGPLFWGSMVLCAICFGGLRLDRIDHALLFVVGGYTLLTLTSGFLLSLLVLEPKGWVSRMFSNAPLGWLGKISYGFYIYHELVIYWFNRMFAHWHIEHMRSLISLPVSLILSWVSFRFLETPILSYGRRLVAEQKRDIKSVDELVQTAGRTPAP